MSDERRYIHFQATEFQTSIFTSDGSGHYRIRVTLAAHSRDIDLIGVVERRINESGIEVYETDGLLNEALTTLQADLEEEKKSHLDCKAKMDALLLEAHQRLSFLTAELQEKDRELARLKKMETELSQVARLQVPEVIS